jgi:hypothetical protein
MKAQFPQSKPSNSRPKNHNSESQAMTAVDGMTNEDAEKVEEIINGSCAWSVILSQSWIIAQQSELENHLFRFGLSN